MVEIGLDRVNPPIAMGAAAVIAFLISVVTDWKWLLAVAVVLLIAAAVAVSNSANTPPTPAPMSTTPVPDQQRQQHLQEYVSGYVASTRGRLETATPYTAVVVTGQKVNHVLHLLISVLLCGLWLPIWLLVALTGGEKRHVLSVDQCGNVASS